MTEREVVGRIEADLAATCPPGSNHAYALVRKTDLRALLSSLAEKEARVGELERERDEWRRLYEREEKAHAEQKAIALKQFNRALAAEARIENCVQALEGTEGQLRDANAAVLAAEARIRELEEGLRPFAEVGRLRASPYCRAVWSFETSFEPDTSGARVTDDDFRRAASLVGKEGGSSRDLSLTTGSGDDSSLRSDATATGGRCG